ncbi:MAG: hypothetical protein PHT44_02215 [Candidatus Portnoybacteria bacterium]|nr:hypothetical protein [Candidatus Portnoybacteria bacterium]MDD4982355.1 hypothetical protein [Candidatus Portnoybacteria bacterium]
MREMHFENIQNRYTGKEYEFDLLGKLDTQNPNYQKELARLQTLAVEHGYHPRQKNSLPFREAVALTKKFQPGDPTNPDKEFAKELRLALAEKLGLESDKQLDSLKFFISAGGPLDAHGVDGFVTLAVPVKNGGEREFMVSFDVTRNPDKEEAQKAADLLIGGDIPDTSDSDFKEDEYLDIIGGYAEKISILLAEKMRQQNVEFGGAEH